MVGCAMLHIVFVTTVILFVIHEEYGQDFTRCIITVAIIRRLPLSVYKTLHRRHHHAHLHPLRPSWSTPVRNAGTTHMIHAARLAQSHSTNMSAAVWKYIDVSEKDLNYVLLKCLEVVWRQKTLTLCFYDLPRQRFVSCVTCVQHLVMIGASEVAQIRVWTKHRG